MSIDNERTGKPSAYLKCEGCQEQTGQPPQSVQRSGGVSGDGMLGREARVTQETKTATGVGKLQRTLYRQAKRKPKWKAWSLYADVSRGEGP